MKKKSRVGGARPGAGRKPTMKERRSVTFYLEAADAEALDAHAKRLDITASEAMRRALRAYLRLHDRS